MATKLNRRELLTTDDLKAKEVYDEYRELKLLLEYVRRPEIQRLLEETKDFIPTSPAEAGIRRRSRL